jgi:Flp pilus assembly protein TadD
MDSISRLREVCSTARWAPAMLLAALLLGCGKAPDEQLAAARALHAKGERTGAILELKSLLQESPEHGESRLYLGTLYGETGDYRSAEKELGRASDAGIAAERVLPLLAKALVLQGEPRRFQAVIFLESEDLQDVSSNLYPPFSRFNVNHGGR